MAGRIPDFPELLAALVGTPSISCADPAIDMGNRAAAECLGGWLEDLGFDCRCLPVGPRDDKVNLIATLGDAEAGDGLALAGHLDTVPYDDNGWDSDPFTLTRRDSRYYGLGTTDMKGFLALAADVARDYRATDLTRPLVILASADEECGMDGARALRDAGHRPARHAVIGEPTGLVPIRRHKGILMEAIRVTGHAGHSSNPAFGVNAIDGMRQVLNAVCRFRDELATRAPAPGFPVDHATLNTGVIHGGDSPNRIPARCELQVDLRFPPGFDIAPLRDELRAVAHEALAESDCGIEFEELFTGTPAMETAADAEIVRAAEQLTGRTAAAVDFGTEGSFYNALGMDTVILGPGDIDQAHQPNEFLGMDRIDPMRDILHGLIGRFCLRP
ncbi:acetylornithine deacetylase [Spectribacter hydrogenoxidans]|uniref:Acetylornithine deacetylase n=1 Tax=Spectribacter hydrogenoxidans TaxID=3075608 RepID=A0ABU3BXZ1_9GAMM|nr:acetylornithine deacetylase [Salinisphaera sp. W335]MDT0634182.1 acetylornithine deacetylase [Salinisphaera sp. W335]